MSTVSTKLCDRGRAHSLSEPPLEIQGGWGWESRAQSLAPQVGDAFRPNMNTFSDTKSHVGKHSGLAHSRDLERVLFCDAGGYNG